MNATNNQTPTPIPSKSYVEVANEPLHKELFKNNHLRVYLVELAPGQSTLMHRHVHDTFYIVVKGGIIKTIDYTPKDKYPIIFSGNVSMLSKLRMLVEKKKHGQVLMKTGIAFLLNHKKHPTVHKAETSCENKHPMMMIGVELIN